MRSNSRPATVVLAALAAVAAVSLLASCSSDDAISPSETTTGIAPETTTTTTIDPGSTSVPEAGAELPGLWLATSGGIVDETGEVWAKPRPGETLRSPLSDGVGGVVYLRCTGDTLPCVVEDQQLKGVSPLALGEADNLMAIGTYQDHRVLLTGWTDTTIVPSFEEDRSGLVARLIDMDTQQVTPLDGWYGWESGPFAADVENGRFAVCFGEGESCTLSATDDPSDLPPVPDVDAATVLSLALDATGARLTWVESVPMSGEVKVGTLDLPGGAATTVDIQPANAPASDDAVTDGVWVAVRVGRQVALSQLATTGPAALTGVTGTRTVPDGVTEMALREPAGGGGGNSPL